MVTAAPYIFVTFAAAALCANAQFDSSRHAHWPERAVIRVWVDPRNAPPGADTLVGQAMTTWNQAAHAGENGGKRDGSSARQFRRRGWKLR